MRLDEYIYNNSLTESRSKAQDIILAGSVAVNGIKVTSKSYNVKENDEVTLLESQKFVSRAGDKLEHAILSFNIDVKDKICLDIGSSTGGFTDCLLQNGAKKIYALDVGHNQLVYKLRKDDRVVSMEDINAKNITINMFNDTIPSIIVSDVSFISISKIAPVIKKELGCYIEYWISLIKPQFEAQKGEVSKGGVIKDDKLRENIVELAIKRVCDFGFVEINRVKSPIKGSKGNIEYLSCFKLSI